MYDMTMELYDLQHGDKSLVQCFGGVTQLSDNPQGLLSLSSDVKKMWKQQDN